MMDEENLIEEKINHLKILKEDILDRRMIEFFHEYRCDFLEIVFDLLLYAHGKKLKKHHYIQIFEILMGNPSLSIRSLNMKICVLFINNMQLQGIKLALEEYKGNI